MLSVESLQVAEEEVVESSSSKLGDIYTFVAKGCFPQTMSPLRKKNLKRYAQKFIIDGKVYLKELCETLRILCFPVALYTSSFLHHVSNIAFFLVIKCIPYESVEHSAN